jgi:hypothetical protein
MGPCSGLCVEQLPAQVPLTPRRFGIDDAGFDGRGGRLHEPNSEDAMFSSSGETSLSFKRAPPTSPSSAQGAARTMVLAPCCGVSNPRPASHTGRLGSSSL